MMIKQRKALGLIYKARGTNYAQDYLRTECKTSTENTVLSETQNRRSNEELQTYPRALTRGSPRTRKGYRVRRLSLEGEAGANLVGGLVQVLGIERGTEAEGDTRAEQDVVGQSGNTTVVDLGL
jgi:hypothetical protein